MFNRSTASEIESGTDHKLHKASIENNQFEVRDMKHKALKRIENTLIQKIKLASNCALVIAAVSDCIDHLCKVDILLPKILTILRSQYLNCKLLAAEQMKLEMQSQLEQCCHLTKLVESSNSINKSLSKEIEQYRIQFNEYQQLIVQISIHLDDKQAENEEYKAAYGDLKGKYENLLNSNAKTIEKGNLLQIHINSLFRSKAHIPKCTKNYIKSNAIPHNTVPLLDFPNFKRLFAINIHQ